MTTSKALVENAELSSMWRGAALEAVVKHSDDGKAYAMKFVSDPALKSTAERLSK